MAWTAAAGRWGLSLGLCLCVCLVAFGAWAQVPSPFDLAPRLTEEARRAGREAAASSDAGAVEAANPFDLVRDPTPGSGPVGQLQTLDPSRDRSNSRGTRDAARGTFDALLAAGLLALFSVTYLLQGSLLHRMLEAGANRNRLSRLLREQQRWGVLVWAFIGALATAAYGYACVRHLRPGWLSGYWRSVDAFMLALIALTLVKLGALELLKTAFPLGRALRRYQMLILIAVAGAGLVALPLLALVSFGPDPVATVLAKAALPLLAAFLLLRSASALTAVGTIVTKYPLHFLLYLCALEIGPLLVLYRALTTGSVAGTT